jgi:hypothetical protein
VRNFTTCACECPSGTTDCGGSCVDLSSDPNNCGECGNTCSDPAFPQCIYGGCGCASNTSCNYGGQSWCCTDVLPSGNCCCLGRITWPSTGQEVCNPCPPGEGLCYCNDGIGGWTCCANGCNGCTGDGNSGLARCAQA